MTPRARVLNALAGRPVDRVPWVEHALDLTVIAKAFDLDCTQHVDPDASRIEQHLAAQRLAVRVAHEIGRCNLEIPRHYTMAPRATAPGSHKGLIHSADDLHKLVFVELTQQHWDDMQRLVDAKDDLALSISISLGIGHIWQTMDLMAFAIACLEDHPLLRSILQRYTDFTCEVLDRACAMGVDFVWDFDDFAFNTGLVYSPAVFREIVLPYARQVADAITLPWVFHSDGNYMEVLDDIVALGPSGLNPLEPGGMDLAEVRRRYPDVTMIGNVAVGLLAAGSPEQVRQGVRDAFATMNHNHRFMAASGNSIPSYADPANVRAMVEGIHRLAVCPPSSRLKIS